jgi:hypothetical protein
MSSTSTVAMTDRMHLHPLAPKAGEDCSVGRPTANDYSKDRGHRPHG